MGSFLPMMLAGLTLSGSPEFSSAPVLIRNQVSYPTYLLRVSVPGHASFSLEPCYQAGLYAAE